MRSKPSGLRRSGFRPGDSEPQSRGDRIRATPPGRLVLNAVVAKLAQEFRACARHGQPLELPSNTGQLRGVYHWTMPWRPTVRAPWALAVVSFIESSFFQSRPTLCSCRWCSAGGSRPSGTRRSQRSRRSSADFSAIRSAIIFMIPSGCRS